jgi:hypothetical protein
VIDITPSADGSQSTIRVKFLDGFATQPNKQLRVTASNICGTSALVNLYLNALLPETPSPIRASNTNFCNVVSTTNTITYTTDSSANATSFLWTVPAGATIVSGQGTNSISVSFDATFTEGDVTVTGVNDCGNSAPRTLFILNNSALPTSINGTRNPCNQSFSGSTSEYSTEDIPGVDYLWTVTPTDGNAAQIITANNAYSVAIRFRNNYPGGVVTVAATNACQQTVTRTLNLNPCSDDVVTGKQNTSISTTSMELAVFPNPSTTEFNLQVKSPSAEPIKVKIMDGNGKLIKIMNMMPHETIRLGNELKSGAYLIEALQAEQRKTNAISFISKSFS